MVGRRSESGSARVRDSRPVRRRASLNKRLAMVSDPRERVAIASGYFRSALAVNPDPAIAEIAVTQLVEAADRLLRRKGENQ